MIKIVSVKVSFWILNYRAYSTAAKSGGAVSSASGGGETPTSSSIGTPASASLTAPASAYEAVFCADGGAVLYHAESGGVKYYLVRGAGHNASVYNHTHVIGTHTHSAHAHTVTIAAHTHTGGAHAHDITYGIYEETNSPVIKFYISENEGVSYNDVFFGGYNTDKRDLEITSLLTGSGSKLIKFTSTTRARLSVQIEIKLDIKARN